MRETLVFGLAIVTATSLSVFASRLGYQVQRHDSAGSVAANSTVIGSGEVFPNRYVKVRSDVTGRIQKIYVEPGEEVKKGQALFLVESESSQRTVRKYSPLAGIVADVPARVGDAVGGSVNPPLMIIADMSRIYVQINLAGEDISKVAAGQRAKIIVDAFHEEDIRGLVIRKDPHPVAQSADPEFRVMIEMKEISKATRKRVRPGMSATAEITIGRK
jgi:multidrug efflux pump subunit AcrA (membrane-fusion protein)